MSRTLPRVFPGLRRALGLLWLLALVGGRAAEVVYQEELELHWGKVEFHDAGTPTEEEIWYTRQPLTFANGPAFRDRQRLCLSNSFQVCTGRVDHAVVWRIDSSLTGAFRQRALAEGCVTLTLFRIASVPEEPGPAEARSLRWTFRLRCERVEESQVERPPTLELALLVDEVPEGVAWRIPLDTALGDERVRDRAGLSPGEEEAVRSAAPWASLFLTARTSLGVGRFPEVVTVPDLSRFGEPVAFGVRALAEIGPRFATNRTLSPANTEFLVSRLSPHRSTGFGGIHRWFPEPEPSRNALKLDRLTTDQGAVELVRVSRPASSGQPFDAERVVATNEWALRVGPFRRILPPLARVIAIRAGGEAVPVERLPQVITNETRLRRLETDVHKIEDRLVRALGPDAPGNGAFFWLPELEVPQAKTVRTLEGVRFTEGLEAVFETNRFAYQATYAPALFILRLGVAYDPNQGFGGEAGAGWTNLVRPGDAFHLDGKVAEHVIEGDLSYQLRYHRSLDRRTELHLALLGQAGTHDRFRIGGLSNDPFRHEYQNAGLEHRLHHDRGRWEVTVKDSALWEAHDLDQDGQPGTRSDDGLLFRHRQTWHFLPDAPEGASIAWRYTVEPAMTLGPECGWDGTFWLGEVTAGVRAGFGGEELDDLFASMRGTVGAGLGPVPPALHYRLSDGDRLMGLEQGEFSGRSYVHGEAAFGIGLNRILGGFLDRLTGPGKAGGIFDGLKLVALAEIAAIAASEGLEAVSSPDEVLSSFGGGLQKEAAGPRGAAIRLGYAWSPDSFRTGGRFFTALSWGF